MKIRFVTSPRGNYHMTEILTALCDVARDAGHDAELASSRFPPPEPQIAYVVIPHEHHSCEPPDAWPTLEQRERTIALCVENPFTPWFEEVCSLASQFPVLFAINRSSVSELRRRGIASEHLQLGYVSRWDTWRQRDDPRPIDVTYLGAADPRRDALVAGYGRWLWRQRTAMLVPPLAPKPAGRDDYLVDDAKYAHLCRTKLLVNLHRQNSQSFEWPRVLQAIVNGCVVVSEASLDHAPLVPGEHFIAAAAHSIPHVVEAALGDASRLEGIRQSAYSMVRRGLDSTPGVQRLVAAAEQLVSRGCPAPLARARHPVSPAPAIDHGGRPASDLARLRTSVHNLATETLELRRMVGRLLERSDGRDPDSGPELVALTPTFRDARPRVSVAVTLHNYEAEVVEALASVEQSDFEDCEVLVLDDASTDGSLEVVREFILDRPWIPMSLSRHRVNRGLGVSRNALARQARGELMFVLDADNTIYPTAMSRLVEALDDDAEATFAYPLLAVTRSGEPVGLLSQHAWDAEQLRHGNYIDAMALIRLDDFTALGGYTEDVRLTGWEDFHFWCACIETGRRGTLVPEVLARYRRTDHSMLGWTETDITAAWSLMHARFPAVVSSTPPA